MCETVYLRCLRWQASRVPQFLIILIEFSPKDPQASAGGGHRKRGLEVRKLGSSRLLPESRLKSNVNGE